MPVTTPVTTSAAANVVFGTSSVATGYFISSGSKQRTAGKVELLGNKGGVVGRTFYNYAWKLEMEIMLPTTAPTFEIGDEIEICAIAAGVIEDFTLAYKNNANATYKVMAVFQDDEA